MRWYSSHQIACSSYSRSGRMLAFFIWKVPSTWRMIINHFISESLQTRKHRFSLEIFGVKNCPIFVGFAGKRPPKFYILYHSDPKWHVLVGNYIVWRFEPSSIKIGQAILSGRWLMKIGMQASMLTKKNNRYISPICREFPAGAFFGSQVRWYPWRINGTKFYGNQLHDFDFVIALFPHYNWVWPLQMLSVPCSFKPALFIPNDCRRWIKPT
jgi:hypothetical protein